MGSGCLACFDHKWKATTNVDVDGSKDVLVEEHWSDLRNPSVASEDFWTNTTLDMESNAGVRSQGSVSSISTSNLTLDSQGCGSNKHHFKIFIREPILNENVTYESLLGSNKRFPRPIPLTEMVQFLVEVWVEEGLCS